MSSRWADAPVNCGNPDCGGMAEPEADGDLRYYACAACGYEFGYEQAGQAEGACSLGVPEEVRRAAGIAPPRGERPVFLGGIGRRPGVSGT